MDADKEKSCKREKVKNSEKKVDVGVFKEGGAEDSKLNLGGVNKSGCSDRNQQSGLATYCVMYFSFAVPCSLPHQRINNFLVMLHRSGASLWTAQK